MLKDGDRSYVFLGTFLPDAVKSQVPVCIQNSLYLHTTMYLSLLFLHIWKTSEDSYNAAFRKLWKEECCTWAMPGFEPEVNSHFSMCYRSLNKRISIFKDAKSIPEVCPEHAFGHNCKQRPHSGRYLDFGPALQWSTGQQWEDCIVLQELYWRGELGKVTHLRGLEKISQGCWWRNCQVSVGNGRPPCANLKKKKKKKAKEKASKASLSSSRTACMTLAVILSEAPFFLCKIKLTLVPLSDRTVINREVLRKYIRTRTENGFNKIQ